VFENQDDISRIPTHPFDISNNLTSNNFGMKDGSDFIKEGGNETPRGFLDGDRTSYIITQLIGECDTETILE
jgi:hypothetical protein